jgi:ribosome-binding factor A
VLQGVMIESVRPGPDGAILAVTILLPGGPGARGAHEVLAALERARGLLRSEIAAAIHRQRVPELAFRFTVPEETNHGDTEGSERAQGKRR